MTAIVRPDQLPSWFDISRYDFEPTSEEGMNNAALAVLDRIPFCQSITASPIPRDEEALSVLREWSIEPYQRITGQCSGALQSALQPSVPADIVAVFEAILKSEDEASHRELSEIVQSVKNLPAREQRSAVTAAVERTLELDDEEKEWISPEDPSWIGKLFTYRIAAYLDLTLWAALTGRVLDVRKLHAELFPEGHDPRSVENLISKLQHLKYRACIHKGGAFDAWQKNQRGRSNE